jgi:hypothetical protein
MCRLANGYSHIAQMQSWKWGNHCSNNRRTASCGGLRRSLFPFLEEAAMPTLELKEKVWREEPYVAVVRLIGYQGIPTVDFEEHTKKLWEQFGEQCRGVTSAVSFTDYTRTPYVTRLKPDIRAIAWPILGPDPDHLPWWAKDRETSLGVSTLSKATPTTEPDSGLPPIESPEVTHDTRASTADVAAPKPEVSPKAVPSSPPPGEEPAEATAYASVPTTVTFVVAAPAPSPEPTPPQKTRKKKA